jgi:hypothetical protein
VTSFEPEEFTRKNYERITVTTSSGPREYQILVVCRFAGFQRGPFYKGVLREGMRVRIADVGGKVAKLEVER